MVIILKTSNPPESTKLMAAKFLKAPQVPDYMRMRGPYIRSNMVSGIVVTSLYEVDNANLAEGLDWIGNYMTTYIGVPGFKFEFEVNFTIEESTIHRMLSDLNPDLS